MMASSGPSSPNGSDLHLLPTAVAIDKGDGAQHPATDIDGNPRDGHPDAGADEYFIGAPAPLAAGPSAPAVSGSGPSTAGTSRGKLLKRLKVRRTRRGYVLHLRIARRARVAAHVDRRKRPHRFRTVRRVKARAVKAGFVRIRLGRLRSGHYRVRLVATEVGGKTRRATLAFRVRKR
jgi:hypothetical protein